jgi:ubiquinone biosynthesis protein
MKADLGIMQNAARVVSSRSEYVRTIDLVGMVDEFSKNVLAELDYGGEAYNAYRLSDNMAGIPGVRVPKVYGELSTSKVLTMEFAKGVKMSNIPEIKAAGISTEMLSANLMRSMSKQLFIDGVFHADPHPGNIFVNLENGDIVFLDLGMVGELDLQKRINLVQMLIALQQQDVKGLAQILLSLSTPYMDEFDEKAYYRDFERTVGRIMYAGTSVDVGEAVDVMFELLSNHGLRLDSSLTLAIKALMQIESAGKLLNPGGGFINQGVEMVKELAVEEITADKVADVVKEQVTMTAREVLKRVPSLQDATTSWLDQYQKGRFEVFLDFSDLTPEVNRLNRLGRLAVIAIVLVGLLIGTAIATAAVVFSQIEGDLWNFIVQLSILGFVFAMFVAILLVVVLLWRWIRDDS